MSLYSHLEPLLLDAGLSESEVFVYLELLKKPVESRWDLVQRTGLSKSSVYRAFDRLLAQKLVESQGGEFRARSLKSLVGRLSNQSRKLNKTIRKIKEIAPFLRTPHESVDSMDYFYTPDQIAEAYLFMAEQDYSVNLDFGDFEAFSPLVGGLSTTLQFREKRIQHAGHRALCTTFGPNSSYFCTKDSQVKYKSRVEVLNVDFKGKFIVFSDNGDYVLFNHFEDPENPHAVLVKSKAVAEAQRSQFDLFSLRVGNF